VVSEERLKIGLVLSGGGARGAAHIGVLKVLEAHRIPVDFIAGTSMGSIVGGLYASGLTPTEIEHAIKTIDWDEVLRDHPDRADEPMIRKELGEQFNIGGKPGFRDGKVVLPEGLIAGQKILQILQAMTLPVAHVNDFSQLRTPFQAVATNIVTGEMKVLKSGDLARAMRASMAVPSIFTPIEIDGKLLVDGGLTNNIPVDIARAMGADIIIAIDISTPYLNRDEISNLLDITNQMTRILTGVNSRDRLGMLAEKDILIRPPLGDISSADFDRADEAIPIGQFEAEKHLDELKVLSLEEQAWSKYKADKNNIQSSNLQIARTTIINSSGLDDRTLENLIKTQPGETIDPEKISEDLYSVHSLGNFSSVSYRMDHTADGVDLYFDAASKSWGPNYLYFGIDMEGDIEGDNLINFQLGYSREELNPRGGIWTSYAVIGAEPEVTTHIYQPLGYERGPFVTGSLSMNRRNQGLYDGDHKFAEYRLKQSEASASIGWEFSRRSVIQLGVDRIHGRADVLTGTPTFPEPDYDDGGVYVQYRYDSLNHRDFPSKGTLFNFWSRKSLDSFGADSEYEQYRLQAGKIFPVGDHRFGLILHGGTTSSADSTIAGIFQAGGGPLLMGLRHGQLLGQHLAVAQMVYFKEYQPMSFLSGYIGALLEYGGAFTERDDINVDNSIGSGSVFLAVATPMGPIQLGIGAADNGQFNYYARIGHLF
jgi:NTE family protein